IVWKPVEEPWFTLNIYGSRTNQDSAVTGGAIRNSHGDLIVTFTMNMGKCFITWAGILGIIEGMKLAWNHGVRKLAIESDSRCSENSPKDWQCGSSTCEFRASV
ncbi:hypothetical protein LINPERHAP1_LOCUS26309, partial [Linum perenne]